MFAENKDKSRYLEFWGYKEGTPEAEKAWKEKCKMMENLGSEEHHFVSGDLAPYRSMATGEWIEGRKNHKKHLKEHKLIEIGNEVNHLKPKERKPDPRLKEMIARQVYEKLRY